MRPQKILTIKRKTGELLMIPSEQILYVEGYHGGVTTTVYYAGGSIMIDRDTIWVRKFLLGDYAESTANEVKP